MSVAGQGFLFAWLQLVSCFKVLKEVAADHRDLMPVNVAHWLQMALQAVQFALQELSSTRYQPLPSTMRLQGLVLGTADAHRVTAQGLVA